MAVTLNDRDIALQSTSIRLVRLSSNYISLVPSYTSFDVVNGVATPSSITITAILNGQLKGNPVFTIVSGASTISSAVVSGNSVATLQYSSLTENSAVIRATLQYLGLIYTQDITIGGQTVKPGNVQSLSYEAFGTNGIKLKWQPNTDADIAGYEVRTTDLSWGTSTGYVFKGDATSCTITGTYTSLQSTLYVRAYDLSGLYSAASTSITPTFTAPPNITSIFYEYADTSLTNATITLRWDSVAPTFGLKEYVVSYIKESTQTTETLITRSNSIILPANWIGPKNFTVKTRDNLDNLSSGYSQDIIKRAPNPVTNFKVNAIESTVQLTWSLPVKTDLPISHVIVKRGGPTSTWQTATLVGTKSGEFTTDQVLTGGDYLYWIVAVDTDDNESTAQSYPITITPPTDFVFTAEYVSNLNGTKVNAIKESGYIVMPVNTTETWQQHFTNNSWTTPSAQISAKYPVYIQPGTTTGSYTEVFDYGNGAPLILGSSNIDVSISGEDVIGTTGVGVTISTSTDNVTYTTPVAGTSMFGINFRYIKVTINTTRGTGDGTINIGSVYKLTKLVVTLSTKLKTDAGILDVVANAGTFVNFNSEFIDITSINITPSGTAPRYCTYDFKDEIFTCNYSLTSNVLTVTVVSGAVSGTVTNHGLSVGQKVRLSTSSGSVPADVYTITSVPTSTSFTVTCAANNSSGTNNLFMYPNTMRVYVFDNNGDEQSQKVSWTVRGA